MFKHSGQSDLNKCKTISYFSIKYSRKGLFSLKEYATETNAINHRNEEHGTEYSSLFIKGKAYEDTVALCFAMLRVSGLTKEHIT